MLTKLTTLLATAALSAGMVGCTHKTDRVGRVRPPADELTDGGRGLQGKDVITASDQMAQSLVSLPELNADQSRWLIVVDRVDNESSMPRRDFDIFLQRLRSNLSKYGRGRVQLVENRERLNDLRARELDRNNPDPFGQGGTGIGQPPSRIQPDFSLYAVIADLPSGKADYVNIRFTLTDLKSGLSIWDDMYEVAVAR